MTKNRPDYILCLRGLQKSTPTTKNRPNMEKKALLRAIRRGDKRRTSRRQYAYIILLKPVHAYIYHIPSFLVPRRRTGVRNDRTDQMELMRFGIRQRVHLIVSFSIGPKRKNATWGGWDVYTLCNPRDYGGGKNSQGLWSKTNNTCTQQGTNSKQPPHVLLPPEGCYRGLTFSTTQNIYISKRAPARIAKPPWGSRFGGSIFSHRLRQKIIPW